MNTNMNLRLVALALAAALAGCGGGGGDSPTGPVAGPAPAPVPVPVPPTQPPVPTPPPTAGGLQIDPGPTTYGAALQAVFEFVNAERTKSGLGVLRQAPVLDLAAFDHANYLALNPAVGSTHIQEPARQGFVAVQTAERISRRGYLGQASETVVEDLSALSGAKTLISAPYHRMGLLESGHTQFGGAYVLPGQTLPASAASNESLSPLVVIAGAPLGLLQPMRPEAAGVSLHPAAGAQGTPLLMFPEIPNPVPEFGTWGENGRFTGYTVSLHVPAGTPLAVSSFTLNRVTANGALVAVPVKMLDQTDTIFLRPNGFSNWAFLVPLEALQADATYEASFTGTASGAPLIRVWRFTTRDGAITAQPAVRKGTTLEVSYDMPSRWLRQMSYSLVACAPSYTVTPSILVQTLFFTETGSAANAGCQIRISVTDAVTGGMDTRSITPAAL